MQGWPNPSKKSTLQALNTLISKVLHSRTHTSPSLTIFLSFSLCFSASKTSQHSLNCRMANLPPFSPPSPFKQPIFTSLQDTTHSHPLLGAHQPPLPLHYVPHCQIWTLEWVSGSGCGSQCRQHLKLSAGRGEEACASSKRRGASLKRRAPHWRGAAPLCPGLP